MSGPRILLLDIETFPDVVWAWSVYQADAIAVREHWYILSYAAQWLGTGRPWVRGLNDFPGYKNGRSTERQLLKEIHALLDEADIVVAHNGVDFDLKKINARLIDQKFGPPSPYKIVDTKRATKQVAAFSSNKLDWLCGQLDLGRKLEHQGFPLWRRCAEGDRAAWDRMKRYNLHDVKLLKALYLELRPWIRQPNFAVFTDGSSCPACGRDSLIHRGYHRALTRVYERFQCKDCGKWARGVLSERRPKATVVGM